MHRFLNCCCSCCALKPDVSIQSLVPINPRWRTIAFFFKSFLAHTRKNLLYLIGKQRKANQLMPPDQLSGAQISTHQHPLGAKYSKNHFLTKISSPSHFHTHYGRPSRRRESAEKDTAKKWSNPCWLERLLQLNYRWENPSSGDPPLFGPPANAYLMQS